MPRGLVTLGVVPGVVPGPPPLSAGLVALGGPHGLGRGSRFSVRDGWTPESLAPPRAEKGLLPNCVDRDSFYCIWSHRIQFNLNVTKVRLRIIKGN